MTPIIPPDDSNNIPADGHSPVSGHSPNAGPPRAADLPADEAKWARHRQAAEHAVRRAINLDQPSLEDSVAAAIDLAVHEAAATETAQLRAEVERLRDECIRQYAAGWQLAHDPRECGHPCACYLDRNWPASEKNYNPETHTSDPPLDYRCVMCELEAEGAQLREHSAALFRINLDLNRVMSGCYRALHPENQWLCDLLEERDKLRKFKTYVHGRLDAAGIPASIPDNPHTADGCRVGGRLDAVFKRESELEVENEKLRKVLRAALRCVSTVCAEPLPPELLALAKEVQS